MQVIFLFLLISGIRIASQAQPFSGEINAFNIKSNQDA
jgi:hypothetical protein